MAYNVFHPVSSSTSTIYNRTPIPVRDGPKSARFSTDPAVTGPGLWYRIHSAGAKIALTNEASRIDPYMNEVNEIVDTHNCGDCRVHGKKHLHDDPMENSRYVRDEEGRLIGMFRHGWMFHNTVNARLGKQQVPFETAWQMFSQLDNPTCMTSCAIRKNETNSAQEVNTDITTGHYINYNNGYPHMYDNNYQPSSGYQSSNGYTVQYH